MTRPEHSEGNTDQEPDPQTATALSLAFLWGLGVLAIIYLA